MSEPPYRVPLTDEQITVIRVVWHGVLLNWRWPIFEYVDDQLDEQGLRLERLLPTFPRYRSVAYGPLWWQAQGVPQPHTPIGVTIAGLAQLPGAQFIVQTFVEVVHSVALRWRAAPSTPNNPRKLVLRFGDLVGIVQDAVPNADAQLVRLIQLLLEHEPATWRGLSTGPDETWSWDVAWTIRGFSNISDVHDYLDALDELIGEVPVVENRFAGASGDRAASTSRPLRGVDRDLWGRVNLAVEAELWDQVTREAMVFFEDYLRRRAGLGNDHHGVDLVAAALRPTSGTIRLGRDGPQAEQEGWHLLARGLFLAVRNAAGHRLDVFHDEQLALGVVGTVSLLLAQIKLEYPTPLPPPNHGAD